MAREKDFELKPLQPSDGIVIYEMLQELPADENGFMNGMQGKSYAEFKQWLVSSEDKAKGIGLEDWQVPQSVYWLYAGGRPVGMGKLRHHLTEKLKQEGGHIGYAIRPSERCRGYGKALLSLLLGEAVALGIDKVLLTIREGNEPSMRTALGNGGVLQRTENGRHFVWVPCGMSCTNSERDDNA